MKLVMAMLLLLDWQLLQRITGDTSTMMPIQKGRLVIVTAAVSEGSLHFPEQTSWRWRPALPNACKSATDGEATCMWWTDTSWPTEHLRVELLPTDPKANFTVMVYELDDGASLVRPPIPKELLPAGRLGWKWRPKSD